MPDDSTPRWAVLSDRGGVHLYRASCPLEAADEWIGECFPKGRPAPIHEKVNVSGRIVRLSWTERTRPTRYSTQVRERCAMVVPAACVEHSDLQGGGGSAGTPEVAS
jgi:hypothetical protein